MFTVDDERRHKRGMDDETPRRAHPSSLTHNLQIVGRQAASSITRRTIGSVGICSSYDSTYSVSKPDSTAG